MKKWISFSVSVLLIISMLAACSSGGNNAEDASPSSNSGGTAAPEKKEVTTIKFMSWWSYVKQPIIDKFMEENPDIKVEMEYVPPGDGYFTKLRALTASKDLPDVFAIQGSDFSTFAKNDSILNLKDALNTQSYDQDITWKDSFEPALLENVIDSLSVDVKKDDAYYGVPFGAITVAVVYNKNIFNKVGIQEPKTWEEFMANNDKLKAAGYIPMSFTGKFWSMWWLEIVWDQTLRGVKQEDFLNGTVKYTDPRYAEAFKVAKDMWARGMFDPAGLTNGPDESQSLFVQGKMAQYFVVPENFVGYLIQNKPKDVELGAFVMPGPKGVQPTRALGGAPNVLVVNKEAKNQEAALKFAKFMTSQTLFQMLAPENVVPSLKGYQAPADNKLMEAYAKASEGGFITGLPPMGDLTPDFGDYVRNEIYPEILLDKMSVDEGVQKIQAKFEEEIKKKK